MLARPAETYSEDFYQYHWADAGVEILLERFNETRDDVRTEITVNLDHQLYGGRLYSGHLLLSGANSRRDVRRELENRTEGSDLDWAGMLEQVCNLARDRYRRGEPIVDLAKVDFKERPRFLLEPFIVHSGISIPYGDGKTAKSLFVLRNCVLLAQQGVKSLWLDWEDDAETHAERLLAICVGMQIDLPEDMIHYQRRSARLAESTRELRRAIGEHGFGHVAIDSLGMAAGDPNNHDLMIEAVRAARALGVSSSCIHHLPKDAKDKTKPFGSVYSSNEARLTWLFEKAQDEGKDEISLLLTNQAFNRGKLRPKLGYRIRFINDGDALLSVEFDEVDPPKLEGFKARAPQHQLIAEALKANGRMRPPEISEVLEVDGIDIKPNQVGAVLRRFEGKLFVRLDQGFWGVMAQIHV